MVGPPIDPMLAKNVARLPADDGRAGSVVFEPKWDGFRCIAFHDAQGRVELQSRQRRLMTRQFPDIARLVREHTSPGTILDGELIIWASGRLDFGLLQRRNAAGPRRILDAVAEFPAHYMVFDVLQIPPDLDVRARPLVDRRALLEQLLAGAPPQLPLSPQTSSIEQAREWLETWPVVGVEGLVIKDAGGAYVPGRRGWSKLRQRASAEAIIGGVTGTLTQPETLLLGRRDSGGVLRYVARTRPVTGAQRAELRGALHRVGAAGRWAAEHPWPRPLPAAWTGQWGTPEPLAYVQVEPDTIAEVEIDAAYERETASWRQPPRFLRLRTDISIFDVPLADPSP